MLMSLRSVVSTLVTCLYLAVFVTARRRSWTTGDVRLVGGHRRYVGTVVVNYRGRWGSVCDDNWGIEEANVVCRQLGYSKAVRASRRSMYGVGRQRMWMRNVKCTGDEEKLSDCPFAGWDRYTRYRCPGRYRSAGVMCSSKPPTTTT
ncbi:galectin-3-binding protein, partial [Aplysia californica]|uniref:Galectin-3-binding protein n=1 Tax=Aplysia californica TaxID=6500 RepID=A0ABM1A0V5_APLCA